MLEQQVREERKNSKPGLPELYRTLSDLIPKPRDFFDSLVWVETQDDSMNVRAWHIPDPIISLRDIPNPMSQQGTNSFPENPGEDQPVCPMELTITPVSPGQVNPSQTGTQELLTGHFEAALLQRTRETLNPDPSEQWEEPADIKNLITAIKCVFYASQISESIQAYMENLSQHVQTEMGERLNPRTVRFLAESAPAQGFIPTREGTPQDTQSDNILLAVPNPIEKVRTTIGQYNKATLVMTCSRETQEANAGAIPFILAQETQQQNTTHQGQFIGRERAQAMQHGVTAPGWKRMTHMNPELTRSIIHWSDDLNQAAGIINWLAHQGEDIEIRRFSHIMQYTKTRQTLCHPPRDLGDRNMQKLAALAIAHDEANIPNTQMERDAMNQVSDAITYTQGMTLEGTEVTATTWNGLLKAIHRWHQRIEQQATRQQWTAVVNDNGGKPRAWEPALGHFQHQDVTATELTDECMLLQEALEMSHCVHLYGSRAEQGTVRVFSLTQKPGSRATASIILRNGRWKEEQTKGPRNHPTTDAMRECTQALVQACNQR